ncbi:MAG: amidohydrolase family protein [Planctomycetota bacterium]
MEELMPHDMKIVNVTACTPGGVIEDAVIVVKDGRIESVGPADTAPDAPDLPELDGAGGYALPGFIDIHCHGAALFELDEGLFDPETGQFDTSDAAYEQGIPAYARLKAREGCTSFYTATAAAPKDRLRRAYRHLRGYMASDGNGTEGARIRGALDEGLFFNPRMGGAQDVRHTYEPAAEIFDELNETGVIKLLNVAPDSGEPAYRLIDHVTGRGVVVGAGHTDATADQVREAVKRGLRYIIHFTNGPTGGSSKPFNGGGVVEATLQIDALYAEQICDGYHINPQYVRDIIARKGRDRIIVITDQVFVAGTDVRTFESGELVGEVAPDNSHVRVKGTKNTLFGSCTRMHVCFGNVLSWLTREMPGVWNRVHPALPLDDALAAAARMCSTNAARMIGFHDEPDEATGSIEPGKWADLVLGSLDGGPGDYRFHVERVFVRGNEIDLD